MAGMAGLAGVVVGDLDFKHFGADSLIALIDLVSKFLFKRFFVDLSSEAARGDGIIDALVTSYLLLTPAPYLA